MTGAKLALVISGRESSARGGDSWDMDGTRGSGRKPVKPAEGVERREGGFLVMGESPIMLIS